MATTTLNPGEEAQLEQTIEMFEVITQSQPSDYQSLEILKEAYSKLGRQKEVVGTSKRIAQAYVHMGQLSSAILEYETILQRFPNDAEVQSALKEIESKANNFPVEPTPSEAPAPATAAAKPAAAAVVAAVVAEQKPAQKAAAPVEVEDGRNSMQKIFVESKIISAGDFDLCWKPANLMAPVDGPVEPFIQVLADKGILTVEKSLKILSDKTRSGFLSLDHYDIDIELARTFPAATCQRWCVLPFDRMSKSIFVATANPFNQQAARELSGASSNRLLWYLVPPTELLKNIRKAFR